MICKTITFMFCLALVIGLVGVLTVSTASAATCTSAGSGNWSTIGWSGCTPTSDDDIVIAHDVVLDVDVTVKGITINNGAIFNNGTHTLTASAGYLTNNGTYSGASGAYIFAANGGVFGTSATTFNNVEISAGVDFKGTSSTPYATVSGAMTINPGGFVANNAPNYGPMSTLVYSSGGVYGRNLEWSSTSGPGYPSNVTISNNTTLDLSANGAAARQMAGNLIVESGSTFSMGSMNSPAHLTVLGSVTLDGALVMSTGTANMYVGGNWTKTSSGTFTNNGSYVYFNSGGSQTITGAMSSTNRFERIVVLDNSTVSFNNNVGVESGLEVNPGSTFQTNGSANFEQEVADSGLLNCDGLCRFNNLILRSINASGSTGSIDVNGNLTIQNASSNFTAPGLGAVFTVAGNFTNNVTTGSFNANGGTITFDGVGTQTISGSGSTPFNTLAVNSGATVILPVGSTQPRANIVNNNGTLRQINTVNASSTVAFLRLRNLADSADSYFGVDVIAGTAALGSTIVSVRGNQTCPEAFGFPVKRCFELTPTNQQSANIKFYYQQNEMQSGQTYSSLNVWNYHSATWNAVSRGGDSGSCNPGAIDCYVQGDNITTYSPFALKNTSPLAVTLAGFSATQQGDAILVTWETASELHNLGFNLYRATSPAGPETQLNAALIPSQAPGSTAGFTYTWEDRANLVAGQTYYYWLEDVDLSGATTLHGPVSIDFGAPTAVQVGILTADSPSDPQSVWAALVVALLVGMAWQGRRTAQARRA